MAREEEKKDVVLITVGGSLIVPDEIDVSFIKKLKSIVKNLISQGKKVALVVGGGKTTRNYQSALREFIHISPVDLDWVGIKSICLNTELMWRAFSDMNVFPSVLEKPGDYKEDDSSVYIIGAHEPGFSSDTDAVLFADIFHTKEIINFSNVPQVYDKDPKKYLDAKPFSELSWEEYLSLIPNEWTPGLSTPFDPIASQLAKEKGIRVAVLGSSLENLENYLGGKEFQGTVIS